MERAMKLRRFNFLLLATFAATTGTAFGQAVQTSAPAGSTQGAAVPDLSGMWVHPYFPGIEPPATGPGPVFNRSRRPDGVSNTRAFVGDYTNPILKPKAA